MDYKILMEDGAMGEGSSEEEAPAAPAEGGDDNAAEGGEENAAM